MELLLIRHGLPATAMTGGSAPHHPADPGLGPVGRRQAARLAARLRDASIDALYVSPLRRALETAEPLVRAMQQTGTVVDGLAEWDRDHDAYVSVEELRAAGDERWSAMVRGDLTALGIDVDAFRGRVDDACATIAAAHPGGRVAVVCHGGVINAYTAGVVGLEGLLWFEPGYTSITRVVVGRSGGRALVALNDTAHLETPRHRPTSR